LVAPAGQGADHTRNGRAFKPDPAALSAKTSNSNSDQAADIDLW